MNRAKRNLRTTSIGFAVALLCLVLAASASAWRNPTSSERRAITRAAEGSSHAGSGKVHVSEIRVSSVGPWASAVVTVYFNGTPDDAEAVLHKVHGVWRLTAHSPGTLGEQCGIGMPRADQRNLGFPPCTGGL